MSNLSDIEHAMLMYIKKFPQYENEKMTPSKFSDGWAFATILRSAAHFKLSYSDLQQSNQKWTFKLSNLKKIVLRVEEYFEDYIHKGIKTKDIDLIEIAKNNNVEEIIKIFELVIAVMTEAPNKEDHISNFMILDQRSQAAFVEIIQNILQNRIQDQNEGKEEKIYEVMDQIQTENSFLKQEVQQVLRQNNHLEKQVSELKLKLADYEEQFNKMKGQEIQKQVGLGTNQNEHLKNMADNLKEKLLHTVRENEIEVARLKEEVSVLEKKLIKQEQYEQAVEIYKQKYNESYESVGRVRSLEREKIRLGRIIEEKDAVIKRLQEKVEETSQENCTMQEKEVYMKMEIQKRDFRYKELEKEVKKRINSSDSGSFSISDPVLPKVGNALNQMEKEEELDELRSEVEELKNKAREHERESNRMKRNLDRLSTMEADKKKLQRLVLDLNNEKKEQVEILLSATHEFYSENCRLKNIIKKSNILYSTSN